MLTLGPKPGARLPPPPPPPQPMLCFLHFPSTRLSCSFSAPFSLLPTCLPLHSFIFRCCFYFPAILSLLLSSAFQGLILDICAPRPLWPWLSLPRAQNPCPAAQGSTSLFWGHMGYLFGPSTWVPVLFVCSQGQTGTRGLVPHLYLSLHPTCLLLSESLAHSPPPSLFCLSRHYGHPTLQPCPASRPLPWKPHWGLCPQNVHLALSMCTRKPIQGRGSQGRILKDEG